MERKFVSCVARTETSLVSDHACDSFLRTYVPEACIRLSSREPPFAGRPEFLRKCWPFRRPISCVRPCSSERLSCHSRLRPRDRNCNDKTDYVFILKTSFKKLKSTNMICGYFLYTDVWRLLGIPWLCFVDVFFWATIFANLDVFAMEGWLCKSNVLFWLAKKPSTP